MQRILISVYFTVILIQFIEGARILAVFPIPSISHQVVFRPLTQELARRGHDVVVVTPDPAFNKGMTPENLTEIDVHEISYAHWKSFLSVATGKKSDLRVQLEVAFDLILEIFEKQVKAEEFQAIIGKKKKKFDILLLEACVRPALSLSHLFDAPVILVSSFGAMTDNFEVVGAPEHPFLYPLSIRQRIYNLTQLEKIEEFYNNDYELRRILKDREYIENEVLRKLFSPDIPALSQLKENVHMLFLNVHPIWDGNRPVPPNVIYMGGMHQNPQKELPKVKKQRVLENDTFLKEKINKQAGHLMVSNYHLYRHLQN